ncbi:MAG: hypothetical protein J6R52_04450 [Alphaproteobacteria bacterium]|nr:hypothetical protein [Alphaproteobacteria bacterium]
MTQQEQLNLLKKITGAEFGFVSAKNSPWGVKYYEHKCATEEEYQKIAGRLNEYDNIVYTCPSDENEKPAIIILEDELSYNRVNSIRAHGQTLDSFKLPGKINGNDIFLEALKTNDGKSAPIVDYHQRAVAVVNINGKRLPFYVSSGLSGKEQEYGIPSGKWYPLQGISESGWLNKMKDMMHNPYPELDEVCNLLNQKFPATEIKKMAMERSLPIADFTALRTAANDSFPEGTPFNEHGHYQHTRNNRIYLPKVIRTWRNKETNILDTSNDFLANPNKKIIEDLQKKDLSVEISLEGNDVWFSPIGHDAPKSQDEIEYELNKHGIRIWQTITQKDRPGFGTPVEDVVRQIKEYEQRKRTQQHSQQLAQQAQQHKKDIPPQKIDLTEKFHNGAQKLEQKANIWFKRILNKLSNNTND